MKYFLVTLLAAASAPVQAESVPLVPLNVRPGQWEMRREIENLPIDLRPVPPEMREKFEQALREKERPRVVVQTWRACVTEAEIGRTFGPPDDPSCSNELTDSTPARLEARLLCRADGVRPVREGTFVARAESDREVHGDIRLTMGEGGQATTLNMKIVGRWVADRCDAAADKQMK